MSELEYGRHDDDYFSPPVPREHGYRDPDAGAHDYSEGPPVDFDVEPYHGKASTAVRPPRAHVNTLGFDNDRVRLIANLRAMPFGGLVTQPVPSSASLTDDDAITVLADWLTEYRVVIAEQAAEFGRQAQVVRTMQDERAAVRAFFGLSTDDYS